MQHRNHAGIRRIMGIGKRMQKKSKGGRRNEFTK